eukprot:483756-Pleurochrysis_carterae.AAC.6
MQRIEGGAEGGRRDLMMCAQHYPSSVLASMRCCLQVKLECANRERYGIGQVGDRTMRCTGFQVETLSSEEALQAASRISASDCTRRRAHPWRATSGPKK